MNRKMVRVAAWPIAVLGVLAAFVAGAGLVESIAVACVAIAVWNYAWR